MQCKKMSVKLIRLKNTRSTDDSKYRRFGDYQRPLEKIFTFMTAHFVRSHK